MKKIVLVAITLFAFFSNTCPSDIAAETIKIASIFAKSGDAQLLGKFLFQGVRLATDELNAEGGILGNPIEVLEFDTKSAAIDSRIAALQAIEHDVTAVIGANWSSHSFAMAPALQNEGIPLISPLSTHPDLTRQGEYIFRVCFTDTFPATVMARFALTDLQANTAVILTNVNSDYSIGLSQSFKTAFLHNHGEILWESKYQQEDTDFRDVLEKVKQVGPDVIFLPGYSRESSFILKQAKQLGISGIFLNAGSWSVKTYELAGTAMDGSYTADHWHEEANFPRSQQVLAQYAQKYGEEASMDAIAVLLAYDAVMVLADAIERAQSLERTRIREALAATTHFQGATGNITFDKHGDPVDKGVIIVKFEHGKRLFVKTMKP